jgi:phosphate transport system permease protein
VPSRWSDRIGVALAWLTGAALVGMIVWIVGWITVNGIQSINWGFLRSSAGAGSLQTGVTGGIWDFIVGTLVITTLAMLIAAPLGVATAVFLAEYRKPVWLARAADTAVDMIFGVPSVVFALFGIAIFTYPQLIGLSSRVQSSGKASGESILCAAFMLALVGFPPVVRASQAAIIGVSNLQREAAYALGKGKLATIRRVVLPSARPGVLTGIILGTGRVLGDTAIVYLLGGAGIQALTYGWWHPGNWVSTLRGTSGTLTTYIYYASPAGEGNTPAKAYGAAFVLMVMIILINAGVRLAGRRRRP